ncbi:MAG: molybdopterin-containing oxidoreductase family protein, partial [Candidatus Ranarchaeia archaeon]
MRYYSICGSCGYHCPITGEVKDGKILSVEGVPGHPVTQGRLCVKGKLYPETIYHPERVLTPLKRQPDGWKEVTWEDAIKEIGGQMKSIIDESGPASIAIVAGRGEGEWFDPHWLLTRRFADSIQTPYYFSIQGVCWASRAMAEILTVGSLVFPDLANTNSIVLWGNNPAASYPPQAGLIVDAVDRGAKLSIIDAKRSSMAKKASNYIMIKPGTDGALALCLINLLFQNDWVDWDFASQWIHGLDDLEKTVSDYDITTTSKIIDVSTDQIYSLAETIGKTRP